MTHSVGDLAEVLDNLGVFAMHPEDLLALCPSGFRRVPIGQGDEFYLSLQGFTAKQPAFAHTHPDSEEWVVVLEGDGQALLADTPVPMDGSLVIGRATAHPHGFLAGDDPMTLLSIQPRGRRRRRRRGSASETTEPIDGVGRHLSPVPSLRRAQPELPRRASSARTARSSSEPSAGGTLLGEPGEVGQLLAVRAVHVDLEDRTDPRLQPVRNVAHALDRLRVRDPRSAPSGSMS